MRIRARSQRTVSSASAPERPNSAMLPRASRRHAQVPGATGHSRQSAASGRAGAGGVGAGAGTGAGTGRGGGGTGRRRGRRAGGERCEQREGDERASHRPLMRDAPAALNRRSAEAARSGRAALHHAPDVHVEHRFLDRDPLGERVTIASVAALNPGHSVATRSIGHSAI